jgi:predicted GH43/DUF377 family glycosyl hydrolase
MRTRTVAGILLILFLLPGHSPIASEPPGTQPTSAIRSIGIYTCYTGMRPGIISFFKACGYNTYQCWDMGWMHAPSHHGTYYAQMAEDVRRMQQAGFKVDVLLSINLRQRPEGDTEEFRADEFDPADEKLMRERLAFLTATVEKFKMADGFTICAGDPGGHPRAEPAQYTDAVKKIMAIIARKAPGAEINVNPWSIASWDHFPSPFHLPLWEKEVQLTRDLISRPDLLGPRVGIEFPMHNYYRSLALKCYAEAGKKPELFPNAEEVRRLQQRGVKRLWGWPYFLTDECDDGYESGTAGFAQSETRYIKQVIDQARRLGLNGMVANAMEANIFAESLNLYAFARFCKDPQATPERVIDEFAGFLSEPETSAALAAVLRFVENHSTWQAGLPPAHRLPNFDAGSLQSPQDALDLLGKVRPRKESLLPMGKPPGDYVRKLQKRLEVLKRDEKKPEASLPPLFEKARPAWEFQFTDVNPAVMSVMPGESKKTFHDPLTDKDVQWEQDVFCPAFAVFEKKLYCVYRAFGDDDEWRLGLAWSEDGLHFTRSDLPLLYAQPSHEFLKPFRKGNESITYGDAHLLAGDDGTFYLYFNCVHYGYKTDDQQLVEATSRDLRNWKVHGRVFGDEAPNDRAVIPERTAWRFPVATVVTRLEGDRLVAAKIRGKYWMYFNCYATKGPYCLCLATSDNLLDWKVLRDERGRLVNPLPARRGYFDSWYTDPVAAVLRSDGILLIYNGINAEAKSGGDPRLKYYTHYPAQALFDKHDPTRLLKRSESPFKGGDVELEKRPIVFWVAPIYEAWSLVPFHGELLLYWNHTFGRRSVGLWKAPIPESMKTEGTQSE